MSARTGRIWAVAAIAFAIAVVAVMAARPPQARALDALGPVCGAAGWISGVVGKACGVVQHGGKLLGAGKKLVTGHLGGAAKSLFGGGGSSASLGTHAAALVGLAAVGAWVLGGAKSSLKQTARILNKTTRPQLTTTWFSSTYWRIAGIAALLTVPFLTAAAIQALLRSDLALLLRAAFGYLPLSLLAVSVASPLTMLLLAASDQASTIVSVGAGGAGARFMAQVGIVGGSLSAASRSPFVAFFVGMLTVAAAVFLWLEMLVREAAVYVVVLMLPLAFASLVWPARKVWAVRMVELLVALILSKFAVVSVLALGGAALGQTGSGGASGMLVGLGLVVLAALAPWALVRLLPITEVAGAAAGQIRGETARLRNIHGAADAGASGAGNWARTVTGDMRRQSEDVAETPEGLDPARAETEKLTSGAADVRSGHADGSSPVGSAARQEPAAPAPAPARPDPRTFVPLHEPFYLGLEPLLAKPKGAALTPPKSDEAPDVQPPEDHDARPSRQPDEGGPL